MNTKQMEYILELSRMKNFNRAAENLFISQPALTYQIKTVEEEIGFRIFERSGRGVSITPAGAQFMIVLQNVLEELKEGIQQGQMHDMAFSKEVTIGLPYRSALYYLPEASDRYREIEPKIPITPYFKTSLRSQPQEKVEYDIVFSTKENARRMAGVKEYPLYQSGIYCIFPKDDPLADREIIQPEDIRDRKLIATNTKYPTVAHVITRSIMQTYHNTYYMTQDAPTVLHSVASHVGVALVPGFLNDRSGELAWVPFATEEKIYCVLLTRASENRQGVLEFVKLLQEIYKEHGEEDL